MLSEALRLIRVFHDVKQNELADKLEISKSYISELESGKKIPTIDILSKYSVEFGIPLSSIMFFSENLDSAGDQRPGSKKIKNSISEKIIRFLQFIEARTNRDDDGGTELSRRER